MYVTYKFGAENCTNVYLVDNKDHSLRIYAWKQFLIRVGVSSLLLSLLGLFFDYRGPNENGTDHYVGHIPWL